MIEGWIIILNYLNLKKKILIAPIGVLNNNIIEYYDEYIIYEGMRYNLTKRDVDIKKKYKNKKNIKYILANIGENMKHQGNIKVNFAALK